MTPEEYREFRLALLQGKATYVRLPQRIDAMSGSRRGSVYAVHNAVIKQHVMAWQVRLADGNIVYVPQLCGNLSLQHAPVAVATTAVPKTVTPKLRYVAAATHRPAASVPAPPKETEVALLPPPAPDAAPVAAPVAQSVPVAAAAHHGGGFFLLPLLGLGGLIAATSHGNSNPPPPATCPPPISVLSLIQR